MLFTYHCAMKDRPREMKAEEKYKVARLRKGEHPNIPRSRLHSHNDNLRGRDDHPRIIFCRR